MIQSFVVCFVNVRILYLELYPITAHNATMTPVVLLFCPFGPSRLSLACICRLPLRRILRDDWYGHDQDSICVFVFVNLCICRLARAENQETKAAVTNK